MKSKKKGSYSASKALLSMIHGISIKKSIFLFTLREIIGRTKKITQLFITKDDSITVPNFFLVFGGLIFYMC